MQSSGITPKWQSHTSFENMILPMLPCLKPNFVWIIDDVPVPYTQWLAPQHGGANSGQHCIPTLCLATCCATASPGPLVQVDKRLGAAGPREHTDELECMRHATDGL